MTRAKFRCVSTTQHEGIDPNETVKFTAATDGGNEGWSKYTPAGELSITITNEDLIGKFKPGNYYYLDISPVDTAK